jgi:CDP-glycerol glycerophosphotransferase
MEHYRGELRGFYFDLVAHAPGPVVRSQEELVAALSDTDPGAYADRYDEWRKKFNPRDDGHAAQRVVARILDQHMIAR